MSILNFSFEFTKLTHFKKSEWFHCLCDISRASLTDHAQSLFEKCHNCVIIAISYILQHYILKWKTKAWSGNSFIASHLATVLIVFNEFLVWNVNPAVYACLSFFLKGGRMRFLLPRASSVLFLKHPPPSTPLHKFIFIMLWQLQELQYNVNGSCCTFFIILDQIK